MAKIIYPDFIAIPNQIQVQRQNLISICRLSVKTLTDRNDVFPIDENSPDLHNFFSIIEHILSHRLKPNISWYGGSDERYFWDFIRVACKDVSNNCLSSVEHMASIKTSIGKGRAWLRICLMEKRLADYMMAALHSVNTLESFYEEGSIMLCEESAMLPDLLLGLSAIDFNFDMKSTYLDFPWILAINFAKHLKHTYKPPRVPNNVLGGYGYNVLGGGGGGGGSDDDDDDDDDDGGGDESHGNDDVNYLKMKCSRLTDHLKMVIEQKRYLDDLLRIREIQITNLTDEKKRMMVMMEGNRRDDDKERAQLEGVIFELQSQVFHLREQNKGLSQNSQKLQLQVSQLQQRRSLPSMLMSRLLSRESQLDSEYETNQNETNGCDGGGFPEENNTATTDIDSPVTEPKTPNLDIVVAIGADVNRNNKKQHSTNGNVVGNVDVDKNDEKQRSTNENVVSDVAVNVDVDKNDEKQHSTHENVVGDVAIYVDVDENDEKQHSTNGNVAGDVASTIDIDENDKNQHSTYANGNTSDDVENNFVKVNKNEL